TQVMAAMEPFGLAAVGANCGRSLDDMAAVLGEYVATGTSSPLWIKPNAGVPQVTAAGVVYPEDPESFGTRVAGFAAAGARILGGCCGTTPAHMAALHAALAA
ncbi:MAG: homocysteine S-methyltransferase family protein, partial [Solirubrobacteraceae bacterium]